MSKASPVQVLDAITPSNAGTGEETLKYDDLENAVKKYSQKRNERAETVWSAEDGSLEEQYNAQQMASENLLRTSEKTISSDQHNRDLWADRFTEASVELYGEPDKEESTRLLTQEYAFLRTLVGNEKVSQSYVDFLLDIYRPMIDVTNLPESGDLGTIESANEKEAIKKYGEAILSKYEPLFKLVDDAGKTEFAPQDLKELFTKAFEWLKDNDDHGGWGEWKVEYNSSTQISVTPSSRKVKIGLKREIASADEAKLLVVHEILVHALRAEGGYEAGDRNLAIGLAGNDDAEEGLGIVAEEAISGTFPARAYDRYIDIALALGIVDGVQKTRQELFEISYARQFIRAQLKNANTENLTESVWVHVDRIYRGGPGDNLGTRQAIFTKDIAYYVGYRKMTRYITDQIEDGIPALEIFDYLSQGKFDPTNPAHIAYLNKVNNKKNLK